MLEASAPPTTVWKEATVVWIGQPICAEMRPRKVTLAGDDIGNFVTLLFMDASLSAFDHAQTGRWERLISLRSSVQDFFGHRPYLTVIVRSLPGIRRNRVTSLDRFGTRPVRAQFFTVNGDGDPKGDPRDRSAIAAVDEHRFQRFEILNRHHSDISSTPFRQRSLSPSRD